MVIGRATTGVQASRILTFPSRQMGVTMSPQEAGYRGLNSQNRDQRAVGHGWTREPSRIGSGSSGLAGDRPRGIFTAGGPLWRRLQVGALVIISATLVAACGPGDHGPSQPYRLTFSQPPSRTFVDRPIDPEVTVQVIDSVGAKVTGASFVIALALEPSTRGNATLTGTVTASTVSGEAHFPGLGLSAAGEGYRLRATGVGLPDAVSQPFGADIKPIVVDSTAARLVGDSAERAAGVYRFGLRSPNALVADSGTIITGAEKGGFIRRVTSVHRTGTEVAYGTIPASLDEAVLNDSLIIMASIHDGVASPNSGPGSSRSLALLPASPTVDCSKLECTLTDFQLVGTSSLGVRLKRMRLRLVDARIVFITHWGLFSPDDVKLGVSVSLEADADWQIDLQAKDQHTGSTPPLVLLSLKGVWWVGVVPIYVDFVVPIALKWTFSAEGGIGVGAGWSSSANATTGVQYARADGWSSFSDAQFALSPHWSQPTAVAAAGLRIGVDVRPRVVINSVAGGEVWAYPYAEGTMSVDLAARTVSSACRTAVEVGAAVDLTILGKRIGGKSFSTSLLQKSWPACDHTWTLPGPNQPPAAAITSPPGGASYTTSQTISFQGSGSDPEDGILSGGALVWTSDLAGPIGTGTAFNRTLSAGTHTITLTATDSKGARGSASRTITVGQPPNQPPTSTIASPAAGASYTTSQTISFQGSGVDPEDGTLSGASLVWTSNLSGQLGTGGSFSRTLPAGTHTITLTAADSKGAYGSASRTITVGQPNQPPTATITSPPNGASYTTTQAILFQGSGTDPEDGTLSGASLVWTSNLSGQLSTGGSFSRTLPAGAHTITLTATDSKGAQSSASGTILVGQAPGNGTTVLLTASPNTVPAGQSSTLTWSAINATSCGSSFSGSAAPSGTALVSPSFSLPYQVDCTGSAGTASGYTFVTIGQAGGGPTGPYLSVNPSQVSGSGLASQGVPKIHVFTIQLCNQGDVSFSWTPSSDNSLITVSPSSGTVQPRGAQEVWNCQAVQIRVDGRTSQSNLAVTGTVTFSPSGGTAFNQNWINVSRSWP